MFKILGVLGKKELINFTDDDYGLKRLELLFISDLVENDRREFFLSHVFERNFLDPNIFFADLGLDVVPSAAEDKVGDLDKNLKEALFIDFALFLL
jgi:hypothetical protein